jgi:hypothetical protein
MLLLHIELGKIAFPLAEWIEVMIDVTANKPQNG